MFMELAILISFISLRFLELTAATSRPFHSRELLLIFKDHEALAYCISKEAVDFTGGLVSTE